MLFVYIALPIPLEEMKMEALVAVRFDGLALQSVAEELRCDRDIARAAVKQNKDEYCPSRAIARANRE